MPVQCVTSEHGAHLLCILQCSGHLAQDAGDAVASRMEYHALGSSSEDGKQRVDNLKRLRPREVRPLKGQAGHHIQSIIQLRRVWQSPDRCHVHPQRPPAVNYRCHAEVGAARADGLCIRLCVSMTRGREVVNRWPSQHQ